MAESAGGFDCSWLDGPAAEYVATLAAETRAVLNEAVRRAYLDGDQDGPRSFVAVAWAVKGRVPEMSPGAPSLRLEQEDLGG